MVLKCKTTDKNISMINVNKKGGMEKRQGRKNKTIA